MNEERRPSGEDMAKWLKYFYAMSAGDDRYFPPSFEKGIAGKMRNAILALIENSDATERVIEQSGKSGKPDTERE